MNKFIIIKKIINEWDPMGLLAMGCPEDEYEPEIKDIIKLVSQVNSIEELALGIQQIFMEWFEEDLTSEKCNAVALIIDRELKVSKCRFDRA